jgi:tRNA (guanine-N7-)-methyltransferase
MHRIRLKSMPPEEVFGDGLVLQRPEAPLHLDALLGGRPLELELCCGNGHFLTELAGRRPDTGFVGVDRLYRRVGAAARKVRRLGLGNVRLILGDAVKSLELHFPPDSLRAVYVLFPDPWPKRRHHKHRLITHEFLARVRDHLAPGGELVIAHDHEDYAEWISARLCATDGLRSRLPAPGYDLQPQPDLPSTLYERKWRAAGRTIRTFRYRRE